MAEEATVPLCSWMRLWWNNLQAMSKFILLLLAFIGIVTVACMSKDGVKTLSPADFAKAIAGDSAAVVLDVRTQEEYAEGHLQGATLLDYKQTAHFAAGIDTLDSAKTYYIHCRSGRRSHEAAVMMQKKGLNVVDMKGGILAWTAEGLPLVKAEE